MRSLRPSFVSPRSSGRAFTLIELLTVIAIIGVLAAILIPVVGKVRNSASKAQAVSNFRQIGTAVLSYISDNRDRLPGPKTSNSGWSFLSGQQALTPPSDSVALLRTYLHSPLDTSIGTYLGVTKANVWGDGERYVCQQYITPALRSKTGQDYPNDKMYIMGLSVNTIYSPFGSSSAQAMTLSKLTTLIPLSRRYILREGVGNTITEPIHGSGFVTVYFDGHVGYIKQTDTNALNNNG